MQKADVVRNVLAGGDIYDAVFKFHYYDQAVSNRTKQPRLLMTPDEVLNMPEDRQILYVSGIDVKPIYANKYPYFSRPEMAGNYLPNPYHKPTDQVPIGTCKGVRWVPVVTEPVPEKYAALPQYQSGSWSYVKAYRPA